MSDRPPRILVVDDDADIREMLASTLGYVGYDICTAASAADALRSMDTTTFSVLVVDVMMPGLGGIDLVRLLRDRSEYIPVLFLSARTSVDDRIEGLRAGGDDYLTKPFSVAEVSARIDALIRRSELDTDASPTDISTRLEVHGLLLDEPRHLVEYNGRRIDLSPTEFRLLNLLMQNTGIVIPKGQLLEELWGYDFGGDSNVVERFISNVRQKLAAAGSPGVIETVRGFGYRVVDDG